MNQGKCPKCARVLTSVETDDVEMKVHHAIYRGLSYYCPDCKTVLGVGLNPVTIREEIIKKIVSELTREIKRK
jgi:uncharacterized protein with PIN domain